MKSVYIVLGMHKSGTTLISRSLHSSGISMGLDISKEDEEYSGNQCESPEINEINNILLSSHGVPSLKIRRPERFYCVQRAIELFQQFKMAHIGLDHWGFKDPRTVLTYEFFEEQIPDHKIIIGIRNPNDVVRHYSQKARRFKWLTQYRAARRWTEYNSIILSILKRKNRSDYIVLDYQDMMRSNESLQSLQKFTNTKLCDMRSKNVNVQPFKSPFVRSKQISLYKQIYSLSVCAE